MNVTVKLNDELCREARHRAVDEGLSLSAWLGELIRREVAKPKDSRTLLGALGASSMTEREFDPERNPTGVREAGF